MVKKFFSIFILAIGLVLILNFFPVYSQDSGDFRGGSSGGGGAGCGYDSGGGDTCGGPSLTANNDYYDFISSSNTIDESLTILSNDSCTQTYESPVYDSGGNFLNNETTQSNCIDSVTISILSSPDMGSASVFGRNIQYLADTTNFVEGLTTDTFTYEICFDSVCDQAIVEVDITKSPDPVEVIANTDQYNISITSSTSSSGNTFSMSVLDNDIYPNNFTGCSLTIDSQPSSGAVSKSGNNLIFTYDKNIVPVGIPEQFTFNYTISCSGVSDSARVDINISASNDETPPPECEGENCETPPPPPPPPPGDCDLCILFGYFNASLGEIKVTLENKLADITVKIGQIALNLTYINNKITENITNPPPPDSGDNPPPPDSGDSGDNFNNLPCNPLPVDYKGGPLAPIPDSSGVLKPWCESRQIIECPANLFDIDSFPSIIFGSDGLPDKFPLDIVGNYPVSAGGTDLILWFQGKKFNISWWLRYIDIIKFPAWIAFMVWVLVRL